jgi:hypothetical protein
VFALTAKRFVIASRALAVSAGLLCGACSGDPNGTPSVMFQSESREPRSEDLLYVSSYAGRTVQVFDYPTLTSVQTLTGFLDPAGLCTDPAGDVYVTDGYDYDIIEYRHAGTKPVRFIADPNGYPWSCSVDPTSGDLAVVNGISLSEGQYGILIYTHARGVPKLYVDSSIPFYFECAYDPRGDLFFDGETEGSSKALAAELTAKKQFVNLTLDTTFYYPRGVVWWHGELAVADAQDGTVDRFRIEGAKAKLSGQIPLSGTYGFGAFVIYGNLLIGTNYSGNNVSLWPFPQGGVATGSLGIETPEGVAISRRRQP